MRAERIEAILGSAVTGRSRLHGGDLSDVARLDLADDRRVVLKTGPVVETEARMLLALASAGAAVPRVIHSEPGVLLMEWLAETSGSPDGWRALGEMLRQLHAHTGGSYGWPEDYAFGTVTIPGGLYSSWPTFWSGARLCADPGALPPDIARRVEGLSRRLPDLLPKAPPASLLHGDLWSGNLLFGPGDAVHLIDPACYHGHAEVDLAMLHLFGAPDAAFGDAYGALEPGWEERRAIYQLWPALVHLRLFGEGYRGLVTRCLDTVGA